MKKTSIFLVLIAIIIGLFQLYLPNKYSNLYGNDTRGSRLMNVLRLGRGILDFWKQSQRYITEQVPDVTPKFGETFDFIVIGAGVAGATIAARLSEIPQVKVLLIEDGTHESLYMDIPIISGLLQLTNINRKYRTKPSNKYCLGMEDNSCAYATGKIAGGGSVLNYMIATRGGAENYDRWAKMGNEGWAYKNILKYFKKLETIDIPELKSDIAYHGTDGPVHITQPVFHTRMAEAFMEAGKEMGYPLIDYNGKNEIGFSYLQATIANGTRMSSNRAYLNPVRDRKNLRVTLESRVTKMLIDSSTKRTIGAEFVKYDQTIRVFANKEVILCAGAIGSPQLLMLSGIGPVKHLTKLGIDVVQDAPVGENLMDHPTFYGLTWTINTSISLQLVEQMNPINPYITDFLLERTGPLTIPGGIEALGFMNTKYPEKHNGLPDIELLLGGGTFKEDVFPNILMLKNSIRQEWSKYDGTNGYCIGVVLSKPKSRGRITLLANDVNAKPEIVLNYFDDSDDMKTMIAGIRTAIRLGQTRPMQALDSQLLNITYTECNNHEYDSDAYWECAIRTMTSTIYHFSGTCKMGAKGDPTAVVDPKLKVIGIQGLRVVDASIMPEITSGHISIPIYMIAEKAADMIKKEWGYMKK
ncbi:PREDICTED: glucose dehydrogenase [FAD, quinone]-like [Wasmannia auropunctata]|uniref:glucose dehydrogenase [FAD, quinone]-like n=1 Tax=Wasmannia auropunctata TaxID=64793 RepID=UPI0005EDD02F|nr:PREDICTED: glucose dehydrogenase [FAD, quinone]-like [Wasmannia auropunctata]XP_011700633.1 PREDICTED: glucose dehydrogenase [FAD, quinone]-like [Wasmannia auropunctata]XP_011700634.1 PREDICTED: glucose dehydrogenase [FAD, quinone]-like [Wasmannia auropunctata]XP_011700635.1 PREDICTED: glucose dehydrogenase [FAD, quinone]-like [Wasmannia auropunctata]